MVRTSQSDANSMFLATTLVVPYDSIKKAIRAAERNERDEQSGVDKAWTGLGSLTLA